MRVDCRKRDDSAKCRAYRTFLDGAELFHCFFSDEEEGVALVFATDEWGKLWRGVPGRDPYDDNVVEVRGNIELRKVRDPAAVG